MVALLTVRYASVESQKRIAGLLVIERVDIPPHEIESFSLVVRMTYRALALLAMSLLLVFGAFAWLRP